MGATPRTCLIGSLGKMARNLTRHALSQIVIVDVPMNSNTYPIRSLRHYYLYHLYLYVYPQLPVQLPYIVTHAESMPYGACESSLANTCQGSLANVTDDAILSSGGVQR